MIETSHNVIETGNKPVTMEIMMASVDAILTKSSAKIEQDLAKSSEEFKQGMRELRASIAETDKLVKANAKMVGGMGNNNGNNLRARI